MIQVYASTGASSKDEIEQFYEELRCTLDVTPRKNVLIVQGHWNAKVGPDAYQDTSGYGREIRLRHYE